MGSSNFLQFNPNKANQLDDAGYASDAFRGGGAGTGSICPSQSFNKTIYQQSTSIAALNAALANKGYVVSDEDLPTLTTVYENFLTKADIVGGVTTVPFSATPVFNGQAATGFYLVLAGNVTSSTLTNITPGNLINFCLVQDGTGNHTFAWPSNILDPGVPSLTPNARSFQQFWMCPDGLAVPTSAMTYTG